MVYFCPTCKHDQPLTYYEQKSRTDGTIFKSCNEIGLQTRNPKRVIYNKVGKCGSTTVRRIMRKVSKKNNVTFQTRSTFPVNMMDKPMNKASLTPLKTQEFVTAFVKLKTPAVYADHLYWVDFTKYGYDNPEYINVLRDPLDRVISKYFYAPPIVRKYLKAKQIDQAKNPNEDIRDWIKVYASNETILAYFCGQEDMCKKMSRDSLDKAKKNVER